MIPALNFGTGLGKAHSVLSNLSDYFTLHPEHQHGDIPAVWDALDEQESS